ncbi:MAG: CapA family protein [Acidimicrobiia bacterium]|nr:CapA family protein [Acidimicrobiia bacterium]
MRPVVALIMAVALSGLTAASADSPGFVDPDTARWEVQTATGADVFYFGEIGDIPLVGDWDCDGVDTPAMYRTSDGHVYIRNAPDGLADPQPFWGRWDDVILAGDFNGDGCDTLATYQRVSGLIHLSNSLGSEPTVEYYFGIPGDKPFVGDFDEDGVDELGLHRESSGFVYMRFTHDIGFADAEFFYGIPDDRLVAGDWNGDGIDTVAVMRPGDGIFYLRNENSLGFADEQFEVGDPDYVPVAGTFGRLQSPPEPQPRSFTIAATGDVLIHSAVWESAQAYDGAGGYDFRPMFEPLRSRIEAADLAICHMEVPLSKDNRGISSYPSFRAPREVADAIADVGFDTCSTASNHTIDKGVQGAIDTLGVLDSAGLGHAGSARGPEEDVPSLYEVNGVTVGHISYTYGLNGLRVPVGQEYTVNVIDEAAILADAALARELGAEFIILSMHWGNEYQPVESSFQRSMAGSLLADEDVDLILGHHAHVVQPIDKIGDEYVVFGMGNLISNQRTSSRRVGVDDGLLVQISVTETGGGRFVADSVRATPLYVQADGHRILPVSDFLGAPDPSLESVLQTSFDRTSERALRYAPEGVTID